jgi:hypothetical protein
VRRISFLATVSAHILHRVRVAAPTLSPRASTSCTSALRTRSRVPPSARPSPAAGSRSRPSTRSSTTKDADVLVLGERVHPCAPSDAGRSLSSRDSPCLQTTPRALGLHTLSRLVVS